MGFGSLSLTGAVAAAEPRLPPVSATGHTKPLPPPDIRGPGGQLLRARLLQVQTIFRHGARLPVEDGGCHDGMCTWTPADTDKTAQLEGWGRVRLYNFGDGDPLDPALEFATDRPGKLNGGGYGGRLTPLGLEQAVELGAELRSRYVDTSAARCAAVRPAYLLPASWEGARRLVRTRSTRVERTVYTAVGVLNGLYPAAGEIGSGARVSPAEIEIELTGPPENEFLVLNDQRSPRLTELFQQGLRLSAANLDTAQLAAIEAVEGGAGWFVGDER